jgi:hypothetical protein
MLLRQATKQHDQRLVERGADHDTADRRVVAAARVDVGDLEGRDLPAIRA